MTGRQAAAIFGGFYLVLSAAIIIRIAIEVLFASREFRKRSVGSPSDVESCGRRRPGVPRTATRAGVDEIWADFERTAR